MARNRRGQAVQNWDEEPEVIEEKPTMNIGDLVRPKFPMRTSATQHENIFVADRAPSWAFEELTSKNGKPTVNGISFGVYMGQKRLSAPRIVKTGKHWSATRNIKGLKLMFHIFMFGNHRIIIPLDDVELLPDED